MKNNQTAPKYYNHTCDGYGFLNRIRDVTPENGQPYLACSINTLVGKVIEGKKTRTVNYDLIATRATVEDLLRIYDAAAEILESTGREAIVMVAWRGSDLEPQTFTYQRGEKKGQQGFSIRARLLRLSFCSINGEAFELTQPIETAEVAEATSNDDDLEVPVVVTKMETPVETKRAPALQAVPQMPTRMETRSTPVRAATNGPTRTAPPARIMAARPALAERGQRLVRS